MKKGQLILGILILFSAACKENEITINIDSNYKGYIYLLSTNLKSTNDIIEVDTNGIVYMPEYCTKGKTVNFTINHKKVQQEHSYVADHEYYSEDFEVSYKTFYFPFYPKQRFDVEAARINLLVEQGKVDKSKLERCKTE